MLSERRPEVPGPSARPDGWYRMTGPDWAGWLPVAGADAEAEIRAGGGGDLAWCRFGAAEPADPEGFARALAVLHARLAGNLPDGWAFTPLEKRDDGGGPA
jgi:hypothetical protein